MEKINEKFVKPIEEELDLMAIRRERRQNKLFKKSSKANLDSAVSSNNCSPSRDEHGS